MIKGIIFDLGNTLLRFGGEPDAIARVGAEAMASWYFIKKHIKLDQTALVETFLRQRAVDREQATQTHVEVTAQQTLSDVLRQIDAPPATLPLVEPAIKVFFEAEESLWQCYPDTVTTLKQLHRAGYRLGLYSNATDDPMIQRLVNQNGLRPWLSPTFSSAGWGWRKPKAEPFELIAQRWDVQPEEMVMVGDTLNADILGAQNAGMHSILVTMDEAPSNETNRHIHPDAVAESLAVLPEIVTGLG